MWATTSALYHPPHMTSAWRKTTKKNIVWNVVIWRHWRHPWRAGGHQPYHRRAVTLAARQPTRHAAPRARWQRAAYARRAAHLYLGNAAWPQQAQVRDALLRMVCARAGGVSISIINDNIYNGANARFAGGTIHAISYQHLLSCVFFAHAACARRCAHAPARARFSLHHRARIFARAFA